MKKTITLFLTVLFAVSMSATTFTFTSDNDTTQTKDGITIKLAKGSGTSAPAWVSNSSQFRMYAKNTITITGDSIGSAALTFAKTAKAYADLTADGGALVSGGTSTSATDNVTDKWTGKAVKSVKFTLGDSGQRAIIKIVVNDTTGGGGGGDDTEITGLTQAYAIYNQDGEDYYWDFDLAAEFAEEAVTYPELYFMCDDEASSKTSIVGTYAAYYAMAWSSASDSIGADEETPVGTMTVTYVEEGVYNFSGSFEGTDGKTYTWNATNVAVVAVDADNDYEIIELSEGGGGGSQYSFDFTKDQQNWTITDVDLPTSLTFVWKQNSTYGMKGSAYNKQAYAAESWLISPSIDLSAFTEATLKVNQAINQGASTNLKVKISTDGGSTWTDLPLNLPAGTSWTFQTDQVSLNAYVGSTIKIAFVYVSTTTVCPAWEIKTVEITTGATALQTVKEGKVADGKYMMGGKLFIQKNGMLFNAQGQEVR